MMVERRVASGRAKWGAVMLAVAVAGMGLSAPSPTVAAVLDEALLVSTDQLAMLMEEPADLRVIDLRSRQAYRKGHLPNAIALPAETLINAASRIKGSRRSDTQLAQILGQVGVGADSRVVLYDEQDGHKAARLLWMLNYFGHRNASALDGGFAEWRKEGRPISTEATSAMRTRFPLDLSPRWLATADWILDHLNDPDTLVIDVRSPKLYAQSHIPGAINILWKRNVTDDGTWKSAEALRQMYEAAGVTKDKNIVVYCQGGAHNAHSYLTLKALGYPRVRSYDRAWPEWGNDPSLPKADVGGNPVEVDAESSRETELGSIEPEGNQEKID